ncbi:MAG: ATP-binding protein [Lachnospiraceae bacterium]|nr:ATP-binding protein [Lachnospiraceae bacterium]
MKGKTSDYKLISKLYFRLLPYQVLLLLINAANGIVDSLFASNFVGKTAMSAIGLYSPLTHFLFAVSIMLVSGSQLLVGEAMGKNNTESVHDFFSTDLMISVFISLGTVALLSFAAATDLTRFIVENPLDREAVNMYIFGQCPGIPALVLGQQLFSFLSMENQTRRTTIASFACIIVNISMNTLLVAVLGLGTLGLGLGSSAGLWAFFLTMLPYYLSKKAGMKFSARRFTWQRSGVIMRRGYPGALSRFVEMFRCIVVNFLLIKYVGSIGLSAFAAVNSVMAVFWPIPFGMLAVTRLMIGIILGEEDRKSLIDLNKVVLTKCFLLQCGITALIMLLSTPLTQMFYRDLSDPVYQMTKMGFLLLPLCMPLAVISLHFACYGQAIRHKFLSVVLPVFDGAVFVVLFSIFLIPALQMNGLYIANILNGLACFLMILFCAAGTNKRFPKSIAELIMIPAGFGAEEDARIDISVTQLTEVVDISKQVIGFCKRRGIDGRRAYFAGLALEEMAGNVVEHGFRKDKKKHSVDIRVVHKDEDVILRVRDNCVSFDPLSRASILDQEDQTKNIGIRLVNGIAKNVSYQNLLGQNVLTIRI